MSHLWTTFSQNNPYMKSSFPKIEFVMSMLRLEIIFRKSTLEKALFENIINEIGIARLFFGMALILFGKELFICIPCLLDPSICKMKLVRLKWDGKYILMLIYFIFQTSKLRAQRWGSRHTARHPAFWYFLTTDLPDHTGWCHLDYKSQLLISAGYAKLSLVARINLTFLFIQYIVVSLL